MVTHKILILVNHEITLYRFRREFILELLKQGHKVYISSPSGKKINEFVSLGCIHINTKVDRRGINPVNDFKLLYDYRKIFKSIKPDIVFSYTIKPNIYGGIVSRLTSIPMIATITGLGTAIEAKNWLSSLIIKLYKFSFKNIQKVFVQNSVNYQFFIKNEITPEEQLKLVAGSGVNLDLFKEQNYPEEREVVNLIFVGRLMEDKGISELFEAAKYFKNTSEKINFHILGFFEDDLKETVEKLNNEEIIIYHGQQSDIRPFLKESHAIIHPSYHEGLSNVLLEAAASGRPILASDIPGCRETFDEGITGYGFEAQSTESLIDAIEKFIELPYERKKKMGVLGRQKIEAEFNRQKVVDAYIDELNVF